VGDIKKKKRKTMKRKVKEKKEICTCQKRRAPDAFLSFLSNGYLLLRV
jgi:hypothetical protein